MPRVLIPLAEGFEEIEAVTLIDVLRRAGVEDGTLVTSRGAGTATELALALVARLVGADEAATLAQRVRVR